MDVHKFCPELGVMLAADNAADALALWESTSAVLPANFTGALIQYLAHRSEDVRMAAADALASGLQVRPSHVSAIPSFPTRCCHSMHQNKRS